MLRLLGHQGEGDSQAGSSVRPWPVYTIMRVRTWSGGGIMEEKTRGRGDGVRQMLSWFLVATSCGWPTRTFLYRSWLTGAAVSGTAR